MIDIDQNKNIQDEMKKRFKNTIREDIKAIFDANFENINLKKINKIIDQILHTIKKRYKQPFQENFFNKIKIRFLQFKQEKISSSSFMRFCLKSLVRALSITALVSLMVFFAFGSALPQMTTIALILFIIVICEMHYWD